MMSIRHLRNAGRVLKSKALLPMMLSLPKDWIYTTRDLAKICKEGMDRSGSAQKELEQTGDEFTIASGIAKKSPDTGGRAC